METLDLPVLEDLEESALPQDQNSGVEAFRAWREASRWYDAEEEPVPER